MVPPANAVQSGSTWSGYQSFEILLPLRVYVESCWPNTLVLVVTLVELTAQQESNRGTCKITARRSNYFGRLRLGSYPAKRKTRRLTIAVLFSRRIPIHTFSELVAHRLARKMEECADFVSVNLDID